MRKITLLAASIAMFSMVFGTSPAQADEVQLIDRHDICAPGADYSNMDLSYSDFSGCDLNHANFSSANLTGSNFTGVNLSDASLWNSLIFDAKFDDALVSNTDLRQSSTWYRGSFRNVDFSTATTNPYPTFEGDYAGSTFANKMLNSATFIGSFEGSDFSNSQLVSANFIGSFKNARFINVNLNGAVLRSESDFGGAVFENASLQWAQLNGNFEETLFKDISLEGLYLNVDFGKSFFEHVINPNVNPNNLGPDLKFPSGYGACYDTFYGPNLDLTTKKNWGSLVGRVSGWYCKTDYLDMSGSNISDMPLVGWDFKKQNIKTWNFYHNQLLQVDASGLELTIDLSGIQFYDNLFVGSDLRGSVFSQSQAAGNNFDNSVADSVNFDNSIIRDNTFRSASLKRASFKGSILSALDFSNADLSGADFTSSQLDRVNFTGANLTGAIFTRAQLHTVNFSGADLSGAVFTESVTNYSNFTGAVLSGAVFELASVSLSEITDANLSGAVFQGAGLSSINFSRSNLTGAIFTRAQLGQVSFSDALIIGAHFDTHAMDGVSNLDCSNDPSLRITSETGIGNSSLRNCIFSNTNLGTWNTSFENSSFTGVSIDVGNNGGSLSFRGSTLIDVVFSGSPGQSQSLVFQQSTLSGVLFDEHSIFGNSEFSDSQISNVTFNAAFPQTKYSRVNLSGNVMSPLNSFSSFSDVDLSNASFTATNPNGLMSSTFDRVNLSGASFVGLNLNAVTFNNVDLANANLAGTGFSYFQGSNIFGTPRNLDKRYQIISGWLLGPGVRLYQADLSNIDFTGVDLRGATLTDANLDGAKMGRIKSLFGVNAQKFYGKIDTLPAGFKQIASSIVGPGVLIATDLRNADFGDVDLSFATFNGAKLQGADLSRVKLRETEFINTYMDSSTRAPINTYFARSINFVGTGEFVGPGVRLHDWGLGNYMGWYDKFDPSHSFSGQNLSQTNLSYFRFAFGDFSGTNLRGSTLVGTDFFGSDLTGADLRGANVSNARFGGVDLDGALLTGLLGVPAALPEGWIFVNGSIVRANSGSTGAETMTLANTKCAASNEALKVDSSVSMTLAGNPSYLGSVYPDASQAGLMTGACIVWMVNGSVVPKMTKGSYAPSKSDIGKTVQMALVKINSSGEKVVQLSEMKTIGAARMNAVAPTILGNFKVGGKLTAKHTSWASAASYSYQWLKNGQEIAGATTLTYSVSAADLNSSLTVRICATKNLFESKCMVSNTQDSSVAPGDLVVKGTPTIVGFTAKPGVVLTGKYQQIPDGASVRYQWLRDGVAIEGAQNLTYTVQSADSGHILQFQVVISKLGYKDVYKNSLNKVGM